MPSNRPRVPRGTGIDFDFDPGGRHRSSVAGRRQSNKNPSQEKARLDDPEARAEAMGRAAPFSTWPRDVLLRLAAGSSVSHHRSGSTLLVGGQRCKQITVTAKGTVIACVSSAGGRRLIFKFDDSAYAYGLAPLVDGLKPPHDVVADGPVTVIRIPYAAIHAELAHAPSLWESIAVEITRRSHGLNLQVQQFVFDAPLVRAAALLLGMLARSGKDGEHGPVDIGFRLPQERLAELLGTSRQWATAVVRELASAGIIEWRYGGVTVLDVQALRSLAARGIDAAGQRSEHLAAQWRVDPDTTPVAGAFGVAGGAPRRAK